MNLKKRISSLVRFGKILQEKKDIFILQNSNTWFTKNNINFALSEIIKSLEKENLEKWISVYPDLQKNKIPKKIGVILAGNIPFAGFHDFLSVIISGNIFVGKLSSKDDKLLSCFVKLLIETEPEFNNFIRLEKKRLKNFDAVIATGSDNSARYFEYYFGKYPNIIRKNRNSAAVLTGNETNKELQLLADDIFTYFGLGCRNVSKLYLPENYELGEIFENSENYNYIKNHNKYSNNYGYNRSIYLMNSETFFDNGFFILKENVAYSSPVSVVFFENYKKLEKVKNRIETDKNNIQCVVSGKGIIKNSVYFGESQKPKLWDYADNTDTLEFLQNC